MTYLSPPPGRPGVRAPVRYSPELGREICARIAAGESQHALARAAGMPSRRTFRDWALREPDFAAAYEAAKLVARQRRIALDRAADQGRIWRRMLTRAGRRGGSVSIYTPQLGEAICARLAAGESVLAVGDDPAMPAAVTIYGWARRNDDFRDMYVAAKAVAADMLCDLALEVALETREDTVRSDRLRIQTLRWRTAQLAPKKYGPRRALTPQEAGEEGAAKAPWTVVVQHFGDPEPGTPQFTDLEGNAVARPREA